MSCCARSDCERGDHHHASPCDGSQDDFFEALNHIGTGMVAVSIRRFADQIIALGRWYRIVIQRPAVISHVTGKQDADWRINCRNSTSIMFDPSR